jgi:hypothetical protein
MNIDDPLRSYLVTSFKSIAPTEAFPAPRTLSSVLESLMPTDDKKGKNIDPLSARFFSTAAIDIWLRGVHSFLVSASLTEASPIWASVAGYYSSHYAVRGLAHLLGYFQLFRLGKLAHLHLEKERHICTFRNKPNRRGGEHRIYWRLVKESSAFRDDDLFTNNDADSDTSDVRHRNHANYSDHIFNYPAFTVLDEGALRERVDKISKIVIDAAPLPRLSKFPDVEFVQLIAYHRIIRFRSLLDEVLGDTSAFWTEHRSPSFAARYMDFQLVEGAGLAQPPAGP